MSCRRRTTVLRIPASALGFRYRREWDAFLMEHEADFSWDPGCFAESLSDAYPGMLYCGNPEFESPDWVLARRHPGHPEIVTGPFLDYCLEEIIPLSPEEDGFGENNRAEPLDDEEKERYLPLFRDLFPDFTVEDMKAVRYCSYEWYDGSNAPYLYSDYDDVEI